MAEDIYAEAKAEARVEAETDEIVERILAENPSLTFREAVEAAFQEIHNR